MKTVAKQILATSVLLSAACLFAKTDNRPNAFPTEGNVCFVGDSITHGGRYVRDIIYFYATRYPESKIEFYNLGISGDYAEHVNKRMESDILAIKPVVSTLMIGMNNGNVVLKAGSKEQAKKVEANRQSYRNAVRSVLDKFAAVNCKVIAFTPSPYDETVKNKAPLLSGKNKELETFAGYIFKESKDRNLKLVDMFGYMMRINAEIQRDNPSESVAGNDRVHPQDMGASVMAANFISVMNESAVVSKLSIDCAKKSVAENFNCDVSGLAFDGNTLWFTLIEHSLPFIPTKGGEFADKYTGFTAAFNKQILKVSGLAKGDYELLIDGKNVGTYSADALAAGVNLADNKNTPQYAQSAEVFKAVEAYRSICGSLREINATEMWWRVEDLKTTEEKIAKIQASVKADLPPRHPYIRACAKRYPQQKAAQQKTFAQSRELLAQVYVKAQPVGYGYVIKPVSK